MELHIEVNDFEMEGELTEMLMRYIENRDSAVPGVHQFRPEGTDLIVTEMRTSRGWHWFLFLDGQPDTIASAWVEERRSETPGAADPGSLTEFVADSVRHK